MSSDTFTKPTKIKYLFLSANLLEDIPSQAFLNLYQLRILLLSDNPLKTIKPKAFKIGKHSLKIYLLRTKLKQLCFDSFVGLRVQDFKLVMWNRTARTLKFYPHQGPNCTIYLYPVYSHTEAIKVLDDGNEAERTALLVSGFRQVPDNQGDYDLFLPCPLGTFLKPSSKSHQGCIECPPGGFYSDTLGYVAQGCKRCPNGSYVSFDRTPGKSVLDCKACPQGTETDFFAGYRACQCLEGFYRTHLFEECHKI
ncbi:hypothetical protein ACROYT_G040334 [Oculina patagonica]